MEAEELIKRGYRALGLGADDNVLAMFDQLGDEPADWVVHELGMFGGRHPAREVVAMDLFGGLPSHYEVIDVEPRTWVVDRRRSRLTVTGYFRSRPHGTWDVVVLPFTHIWRFADGRVDKVTSLLDGVEIRRRAPQSAGGRR